MRGTSRLARFHEDMKVPDWFDPGQLTCRIVRPRRADTRRMSIRCLRWVCLPGAPLRHSDVLTTPGWMVPARSKTLDYLARQRFPPQEVIHRPVGNARFGRSISTMSVAIELDQPLVADPEVMRDLVEHDVPDLAA